MDVREQRPPKGRVHPGHGLVEHQEARTGHQAACHLEQLALAAGEGAGELPAQRSQAEAFE